MADRDPELIKADIDQARDRLALTVDSLTERANPQRIADDIKGALLAGSPRSPPHWPASAW